MLELEYYMNKTRPCRNEVGRHTARNVVMYYFEYMSDMPLHGKITDNGDGSNTPPTGQRNRS